MSNGLYSDLYHIKELAQNAMVLVVILAFMFGSGFCIISCGEQEHQRLMTPEKLCLASCGSGHVASVTDEICHCR